MPEEQSPAIRPSYYSSIAFLHLISQFVILHITVFITGMSPPDCILHLNTIIIYYISSCKTNSHSLRSTTECALIIRQIETITWQHSEHTLVRITV